MIVPINLSVLAIVLFQRWEVPTSFAFLYGNRYKIVLKSIQSEIVSKSVQDKPKLKVL